MPRPNEMPEMLKIAEADTTAFTEGSGCRLVLMARQCDRRAARPAYLALSNDGFEATYLASHDDLVAIRDWTSKAIAALEATRPELADAGAWRAEDQPEGKRALAVLSKVREASK